jgi:hypothetical protein
MLNHHMQVPEDVYVSYRVLYARSRAGRYRMVRFDAAYVRRVLIDQELAVITRWVGL